MCGLGEAPELVCVGEGSIPSCVDVRAQWPQPPTQDSLNQWSPCTPVSKGFQHPISM